MLAGRALVSDVPTLLKHLVEDGEAPGPVAVTLVAPADLSIAPHWQNRQAIGGNAADAGLRAGDPDLCLTELVECQHDRALTGG